MSLAGAAPVRGRTASGQRPAFAQVFTPLQVIGMPPSRRVTRQVLVPMHWTGVDACTATPLSPVSRTRRAGLAQVLARSTFVTCTAGCRSITCACCAVNAAAGSESVQYMMFSGPSNVSGSGSS